MKSFLSLNICKLKSDFFKLNFIVLIINFLKLLSKIFHDSCYILKTFWDLLIMENNIYIKYQYLSNKALNNKKTISDFVFVIIN